MNLIKIFRLWVFNEFSTGNLLSLESKISFSIYDMSAAWWVSAGIMQDQEGL